MCCWYNYIKSTLNISSINFNLFLRFLVNQIDIVHICHKPSTDSINNSVNMSTRRCRTEVRECNYRFYICSIFRIIIANSQFKFPCAIIMKHCNWFNQWRFNSTNKISNDAIFVFNMLFMNLSVNSNGFKIQNWTNRSQRHNPFYQSIYIMPR